LSAKISFFRKRSPLHVEHEFRRVLYSRGENKSDSYSKSGLSMKFHALKVNLRSSEGNGFIEGARRALSAALFILLISVAASAYTIVLKSGRHIEIPSSFTVTSLTLTYEAAPGLNVTLMMSTIDIPATERANNETSGSLLKRAEQKPENNEARTQSRNGRRELTQADIERARIERQRSEEAYERRRRELGLPSLEEARRRTEEETKRLREESLKSQISAAEWESYWRGLASQLRTEMAVLDAQINYIRSQLEESPDSSSIASYALIIGAPAIRSRHATTIFPVVTGNPGFMRGANGASGQGAGFLAFGGSGGQAGIRFNAGESRVNFGGRVSRGFTGVGAVPYISPDYYYDRNNLISRLHELVTARAGLQARWRALKEEARRAGAQPGWLRP
jgi:hypothetical protein